jgi:hypothetical protein
MERTISDIQTQKLNDLYWTSSRTVDEIVEELGVGRNTLYASVRPLPAGEICRTCGNQIVFTNRTGRASGLGICEGCGLETAVGDAASLPDAPVSEGRQYRPRRLEQWREEVASVAPQRAALIGGAAALGIIVGAVAARTIRG